MSSKKPWRSRIVGHAELPPGQVVPNDRNWRKHPKAQLDALAGAIDEIGFIRSVTVNRSTGRLIDGHGRLKLAIERNEPFIPVEYVDLTPDEERLALATLDALTEMAETDQEALDSLVAGLHASDARLRVMLDSIVSESAVTAEDIAGIPEHSPEEIEVKPPPQVVWLLIGVPLAAYHKARQHVMALQGMSAVSVQTNRDGEANGKSL